MAFYVTKLSKCFFLERNRRSKKPKLGLETVWVLSRIVEGFIFGDKIKRMKKYSANNKRLLVLGRPKKGAHKRSSTKCGSVYIFTVGLGQLDFLSHTFWFLGKLSELSVLI